MCCGEEIQTTAFTRMIHEQLLEEIQTTATTTPQQQLLEEIQTTAFTRMIHEQLLLLEHAIIFA
jgi:hypothetical protein